MILSSLSIYLIASAIALFLTIAISMMLRRLFRPKGGPRGEPRGPRGEPRGPRGAPRALQGTMIVTPAPTATTPPVADAVAVATNSASTEIAIVDRSAQAWVTAPRGHLFHNPRGPRILPPRGLGILPRPHRRGILPPPPRRGPGPWKDGYRFQ